MCWSPGSSHSTRWSRSTIPESTHCPEASGLALRQAFKLLCLCCSWSSKSHVALQRAIPGLPSVITFIHLAQFLSWKHVEYTNDRVLCFSKIYVNVSNILQPHTP